MASYSILAQHDHRVACRPRDDHRCAVLDDAVHQRLEILTGLGVVRNPFTRHEYVYCTCGDRYVKRRGARRPVNEGRSPWYVAALGRARFVGSVAGARLIEQDLWNRGR